MVLETVDISNLSHDTGRENWTNTWDRYQNIWSTDVSAV